jgi:hypothetical protein
MPEFKENKKGTNGYKMKSEVQTILKDFKFAKNPYETSKKVKY